MHADVFDPRPCTGRHGGRDLLPGGLTKPAVGQIGSRPADEIDRDAQPRGGFVAWIRNHRMTIRITHGTKKMIPPNTPIAPRIRWPLRIGAHDATRYPRTHRRSRSRKARFMTRMVPHTGRADDRGAT